MNRQNQAKKNKRKSVYVSSTFVDLSDFRKAVTKGIRRLGAIDISMENFGATDERPKDTCLQLIREESDVYVGIFAYRYGHIIEGDDMSITEAEYREAGKIGIPRLIYILDEEAPWSLRNIEKGRGGSKLRKLKKELKTNHICGIFSQADELATKVVADLGRVFSILAEKEKIGY